MLYKLCLAVRLGTKFMFQPLFFVFQFRSLICYGLKWVFHGCFLLLSLTPGSAAFQYLTPREALRDTQITATIEIGFVCLFVWFFLKEVIDFTKELSGVCF